MFRQTVAEINFRHSLLIQILQPSIFCKVLVSMILQILVLGANPPDAHEQVAWAMESQNYHAQTLAERISRESYDFRQTRLSENPRQYCDDFS